MDISFENSQGDSSPIKLMSVTPITTSPFIPEIQPVIATTIKPTQIESTFGGSAVKTERPGKKTLDRLKIIVFNRGSVNDSDKFFEYSPI